MTHRGRTSCAAAWSMAILALKGCTYEAGNAGALLAGDPKVGRASVQDHIELLGRGTDRDGRIVLRIHVI